MEPPSRCWKSKPPTRSNSPAIAWVCVTSSPPSSTKPEPPRCSPSSIRKNPATGGSPTPPARPRSTKRHPPSSPSRPHHAVLPSSLEKTNRAAPPPPVSPPFWKRATNSRFPSSKKRFRSRLSPRISSRNTRNTIRPSSPICSLRPGRRQLARPSGFWR